MLTREEAERYKRHLVLPQVGEEGQLRLKQSSVVVVGAGGLGSPVLLYLAAAGVGRIGIVDADVVDPTNLQRQVVHGTASVSRPKVDSALERLRDLNPLIAIEPYRTHLNSRNAREILSLYDIVIDGSDNFPTRYLVNDACVMLGKPNVYGSIFRFEGQASVFLPRSSPCYRCLYPEPPPPELVPSCEEGGVLGVVPGMIGIIQATEAVKLCVGIGTSLAGRLLLFDALDMRLREVAIRRRVDCKVCGDEPTVTELIDYELFCTGGVAMSGVNQDVTPAEVSEMRARGERFRLIDVREPHEWSMDRLEGAELIPLATLEDRMSELEQDETIVLYCRSGARSGHAANVLRAQGYRDVRNVLGGIVRWARELGSAR